MAVCQRVSGRLYGCCDGVEVNMEIKSINDILMPFSNIDVAEAFYHHSELYMKTENVSTTITNGNFATLVYNAVNLKNGSFKSFAGLENVQRAKVHIERE